MLDKTIDNIFKIFYSKNRTKLYIIIVFLAGFILRLIAASNTGLSADDSVHAVRAVGVIESGKLVEYGQSSILWYYIQEIFYKLFGTSNFGSRMATAIFGSFFAVLMFLFVKQVFKSEKAGLIAAVISAFSPFFIKITLPEMDVTVMFFVIFSALFMFKFLENLRRRDLIITASLMGIAILIKVYAIFFAVSFFLYLIYQLSKKEEKGLWKKMALYLFILFVFFIPTLAHNYLLYRDKGFADLLFSNFFHIGGEKAKEVYGWTESVMITDYKGFFLGKQKNFGGENAIGMYRLPGFIIIIIWAIKEDLLIMIFGLLGLLTLLFKKERRYLVFFVLAFLLPYIYLGAHIPMLKHFTFVPVLFVPFSAIFIDNLDNFVKNKIPKFKLKYILILFILFDILWLGMGTMALRGQVFTKSAESQIINYRISSITKDSLVVIDSRIYRGYIAWMFNERNYLESSLFGQAIEESKKYGNPALVDVYFIECEIDDCGWGTIKDQPDFNKSMEDVVLWFKNNSQVVAEIKETDRKDFYFPFLTSKKEFGVYRVYKTSLMLSPSIITIAKSTHNVIGYPLGYDKSIAPIFDDYETHNAVDTLINKLAHFILYIYLLLSFITIIFLIYLFLEEP